MGDARRWIDNMEQAALMLGPPDIRVRPWKLSAGGTGSTTFDTLIGDWVVTGKAEIGQSGPQVTHIGIDFNPFTEPDINNLPPAGSIPARRPPSNGITNDVIRRIPLARIKDAVQRDALAQPQFDLLFSALGPDNRVPRKRRRANRRLATMASQKGATGKGRPRLGDEHWQAFALTALRFYAEERTPLRSALAKELDQSPETIRDWMGRARDEGFLAKTSGGSKEVYPGPRLLKEGRRKK